MDGWLKKIYFQKVKLKIYKKKLMFLKENIKSYHGRDINFFNDKPDINTVNSFHRMDDCSFVKKLALNSKFMIYQKNT